MTILAFHNVNQFSFIFTTDC